MEKEVNCIEKCMLQSALADHRLSALANFKEVPFTEIKQIPLDWEDFPNILNSKWKLIETLKGDNKSVCRFILGGNGIFNTHVHTISKEKVTILTPNCKIEWIDETGIYYYGYGDSFEVDKGVKHALVNHSNFPVEFIVEWSPAMKGWEAAF